jgi:hypothetical protein
MNKEIDFSNLFWGSALWKEEFKEHLFYRPSLSDPLTIKKCASPYLDVLHIKFGCIKLKFSLFLTLERKVEKPRYNQMLLTQ